MTLTEFLLARIAEDEAHHAPLAARATPPYDEPHRRWLTDCEAKRRIVELHYEATDIDPGGTRFSVGCAECGDDYETGWPCPTLRALALPYADHPDYREEWKP